jgi:hypothetical protein
MLLSLLLALPFAQDVPLEGPAPSEPRVSEVDGFQYVPGVVEVGRLLRYRKSNVDGTHATRVDLYLASEDRIESLKWNRGWPEATLVVADMDWRTCSVRRFQTWKLFADGTRQPVARLEASADGKELVASAGGGELRCEVTLQPWHSYDFDLASLNVSLPFLTEPEGRTLFGIIDAGRAPDGRLALLEKGLVELAYLGDEDHADVPCRRYSIDGPGLADRGGDVWVSREDPCIVDLEIDLPDEGGMVSNKLLLLERTRLSAEEWAALPGEVLR